MTSSVKQLRGMGNAASNVSRHINKYTDVEHDIRESVSSLDSGYDNEGDTSDDISEGRDSPTYASCINATSTNTAVSSNAILVHRQRLHRCDD